MLKPLSSRMAMGLGMTQDEWLELRSQVDDSFWVMRVIGEICFCSIYDSSFTDWSLKGIHRYQIITRAYPAEPTSEISFHST